MPKKISELPLAPALTSTRFFATAIPVIQYTVGSPVDGVQDLSDPLTRRLMLSEIWKVSQRYDALSFRNLLINGSFDVWQRGTEFTISGVEQKYTADRWLVVGGDALATLSVSREELSGADTFDLSENPATNCMTVTQNAYVGGRSYIAQRIEGLKQFTDRYVGVSAGIRYNIADYVSMPVQLVLHHGTGGAPASDVTIDVPEISLSGFQGTFLNFTLPWAELWELVGEIGTDGNDYLEVRFYLPENTEISVSLTEVALENSWYLSQGVFSEDDAGAQLSTAPFYREFERRPVQLEELLCKRYYLRVKAEGTLTTDNPEDPVFGILQYPICRVDPPIAMRVASPALTMNVTYSENLGASSAAMFDGYAVVYASSDAAIGTMKMVFAMVDLEIDAEL